MVLFTMACYNSYEIFCTRKIERFHDIFRSFKFQHDYDRQRDRQTETDRQHNGRRYQALHTISDRKRMKKIQCSDYIYFLYSAIWL